MKILFFNEAIKASISAGNAEANFPAANVIHPALKKRFQSTANSDTMTFSFSENKTINSFFLGWTNADTVTVTLKNSGGSTLYTETKTITRPDGPIDYRYQSGALMLGLYVETQYEVFESFHLPELDTVRTVTVQASTSEATLFIGGVGFGSAVTFKDPGAAWDNTFDDNSKFTETTDGQGHQNYFRPLSVYSFEFSGLSYELKNDYRLLYLNTAKGAHVWGDFFEGNHDYMAPGYYSVQGFSQDKKSKYFSVKLSLKEAR